MSFIQTTSNESGFSLIEVLLVGIISVILLAGIYGFWQFFVEGSEFVLSDHQSADHVYAALSKMTSQIRSAELAANGAYVLDITNDTEFSFYSDHDRDGEIEKIRLFFENERIMEGVIEPAGSPVVYDPATESVRQVVEQVGLPTEPLFTYYPAGWTGDGSVPSLLEEERALNTSVVTISFSVELEGKDEPVGMSRSVQLRNLHEE